MIAGIIQARIGSQRCKNKMLRDFAGTNLISLALGKYSVEPKSFKLYFAAHEKELLNIGRNYNCAILERDQASADGEKIEIIMNYLHHIQEEYVMFINACCPFLMLDTLNRAVKCFEETKALSMTSVVKSHTWYYFQDGRPINFLDPTTLNTKHTEPLYAVTHSFHIFNRKRFLEKHHFWNHGEKDPYFFEISEQEAVDIDTEFEYKLAESLYLREQQYNTSDLTCKLNKIKMLIMDVDGVLTDAGMYYSEDGNELKKFNTRDGMGLKMLRQRGIKQAIITGENTQIVKNRAKKLKIDEIHLGIDDKASTLQSIISKYSLKNEEIAYIGDDLNDIDILKKVGLAFTVSDAPVKIKLNADYVTIAKGGDGAVREVCDILLKHHEQVD